MRRGARLLAWAALGAAGLLPAFGATAGSWLRLETRNFIIYTQGHERKARDKAIEFERFIAGLDALFPRARPHRTPLTIVLFGKAEEFHHYTPVVNGVVQPVGGFFTRLPHRGFIAMPLEGDSQQVRRLIFHEGVHWYFSFLPAGRPVWFDEGLAEVLSTFELRRREDVVGRAVDEHVLVLNFLVRPPLAQLLQTPREAIDFNEATRTGGFYALSWAFVHYLLFGRGGNGSEALAEYLGLLEEGRRPAEAFAAAFGTDYAGMEQRLYEYLKSGKYGMIRTKFDPDAIDRGIRRSEATATEMDLTLGYLSLVGRRREAAARALERVRATNPDDPATSEAWGMLELARGNDEEARSHFERAVRQGSQNFICYFARAAAQVRDWRLAAIKTEDIPPERAREVAYDLQRTINLEPLLEEAYAGLAEMLVAAEPLTREDRKFLEVGAKRFPRNTDIEVGLATFDLRTGQVGAAFTRLEALLGSDREIPSTTRDRAENLRRKAQAGHRLERLADLVRRGELAAAEAGIAAALGGPTLYPERLALLGLQKRLARRQVVERAVAAHRAGRADEARRILQDLGPDGPEEEDADSVQELALELAPAGATPDK